MEVPKKFFLFFFLFFLLLGGGWLLFGKGSGGRSGTEDAGAASARGGGVKGSVVDHKGRPVSSFTVEGVLRSPLRHWSVRGRKDGTFQGSGLEPGVWGFRVMMENGPFSSPRAARISEGEVADLGTFRLPSPAALVVAVRDEKGEALEGISVELIRNLHRRIEVPFGGGEKDSLPSSGSPGMSLFYPGPEKGPSARTGKDGLCRLGGLTPGLWWVRGKGRGFVQGWCGPVRLGPGEEKKWAVRLSRGGGLLVEARDGKGKPRAGVELEVEQVEMKAEEEPSSFPLRTDSKGKAGKEGIPPGVYRVHLYRRVPSLDHIGYPRAQISAETGKSWEVRVEVGKTARLEIVLE